MQHAAFGVHLIEFHAAGLRHAQAMPEHEQQKATVAGLVPPALGRLDQPLNLAPGEVLPVAVRPACAPVFSPVHHFVESLPGVVPLKPASTGQGTFPIATKEFILCAGSVSLCASNSRTVADVSTRIKGADGIGLRGTGF